MFFVDYIKVVNEIKKLLIIYMWDVREDIINLFC